MLTTCPSAIPTEVNGNLTRRETQLAKLVGLGWHNKAIAAELHLTPMSVKTYLGRVYKKLRIDKRVHTRVALARLLWQKTPDVVCADCSYVEFAKSVQASSLQVLAESTLEGK